MDNFEILNRSNTKIIFSDSKFSDDGWLVSYLFSIFSDGINASIRVDNPPYGKSPLVLFEQMNNEWSGWEEPKSWQAIEGEYNLVATYDNRGHILLSAEIDNQHGSWSAVCSIDIEAGELEPLVSQAKAFFGY